MLPAIRSVVACLLGLTLAACSLPSGAALQSDVLRAQQGDEAAPFQVVEVTRAQVAALARWPVTGWSGGYHWPRAGRAPDSAVIRSGDRLDISIWDTQENSLLATPDTRLTEVPTMTVDATGAVFMPYVGEVVVRGLTADAARARLQSSLGDIAPSAQVQLSVLPGRNNAVDVVAGVGAPGQYPLDSRNTRILGVLAGAGGVDAGLRHPLVVLQRGGQRYEVRAEALFGDPARNILMRGGDQVVVIEDKRSFNALGAAGEQKVIHYETERMTAMEAVSAMGGLRAARADPKGLLVLRDYPAGALDAQPGPEQQQVVFTLDLSRADGLFAARAFEVHPGDTVLATESPVTRVQTILGLFGTVVGIGATTNNLSD
ncbi:MAG: polysaccharide biosynthesis/export family protein [Roseovarius sp.]|nr:polysaccharide biosynthesis/export family protein [Roseovarius sp.]